MNNLKVFRAMEWFWLVITILMATFSSYLLISSSFDAARMPLFGTFCSAVLYALRRYQRKKVEARMKGQ
ncbi:MAG: hypothetical protein ACK5CY_01360 [Bacteroidia bacterium]|jgi:hypothetical protein